MRTCFDPESGYRLGLRIAGVSIELQSFLPWKLTDPFLPFVAEVPLPDYRVVFRLTDALPPIPPEVIYEGDCYRVHPDGKNGYLRSFFDAMRDPEPYAVAEYDRENGLIRIDCLARGAYCISDIHNSFFHIDFEAMLMDRQRLCLHAACVDTHLGGILFSGPSGIGKSTQAQLWCSHRGARQINGDRPILSGNGGDWLAWGSPYAGSSGCHLNEHARIRAIVMLEQGQSCRVCRLNVPEAFRAVWSGLTIHSWDKNMMEQALDLIMDLIREVPVYRFVCTADENAVQYLEAELGKDVCLWEKRESLPVR